MKVTKHFIVRVRERIGGHVDPVALAARLLRAIDSGDEAQVRFVSRLNKDGRRVFRFEESGREYFALINTDQRCCISVFPPGFALGRQEKSRLELR